MNRRDFLRLCGQLGLAIPAAQLLGCAPEDPGWFDGITPQFDGSVLIVGAGAAGLAAGYLLHRFGIDFTIVEARDRIGGRTKGLSGFADFPIDLGAEWIHDEPELLGQLLDDPSLSASVEVVPYSPETLYVYDGALLQLNAVGNYYGEYKFRRSGWFEFLDQFVAEPIRDRIRLGLPVTSIDTSDPAGVTVVAGGETLTADRVLVTVPTAVLQAEVIAFTPPLSEAKLAAIDTIDVAPGLKVFMEFEERFYPDLVSRDGVGQNRLYYDAAFGKDSDRNVLALFWVEHPATELTDLDDDAILAAVLADLDDLFDGAASAGFVQGVVQNWTGKEWTRGAYTWGPDDGLEDLVATIREPVDDRLWFAGETLATEATSTVQGAMESAYTAARGILERPR